MKKRALAAVLWFYAFWYTGAMIADIFGMSVALGPILGTAAAAIIAGDPRGLIWGPRRGRSDSSAQVPSVSTGNPTIA